MRALSRKLLSLIAALAVLALLGVQQGQVAHEFSHLAQGGSASLSRDNAAATQKAPDKNAPHSKTCDKCAFYAELNGNGSASPVAMAPAAAAGGVLLPGLSTRFASTYFAAYSARAPPFFA